MLNALKECFRSSRTGVLIKYRIGVSYKKYFIIQQNTICLNISPSFSPSSITLDWVQPVSNAVCVFWVFSPSLTGTFSGSGGT